MKTRYLFFNLLLLLGTVSLIAQPTVTSNSPVKNALNVSKSSDITVKFSEGMNPATISQSTIKVFGNLSGFHSGSISYNNGNFTATYNPNSDFTEGESVVVTVTNAVQNSGNINMVAPYNWQFNVLSGITTSYNKTKNTDSGNPALIKSADLNKDGKTDIISIFNSGSKIGVFISNGEGTFASRVDYGTGSYPYDALLADVNGDGYPDIVSSNWVGASISVLLNNQNGTFAAKNDYYSGTDPYRIASGDFDGDGDIDIVTGSYDSDSLVVNFNNGSGVFFSHTNYFSGDNIEGITVADINGDGAQDILASNVTPKTVSVLTNNGYGLFSVETPISTSNSPGFLVNGDIDNDGDIDLLVSQSATDLLVLKNSGSGSFESGGTYKINSNRINCADMDGDGDLDVVGSATGGEIAVIVKNDGTGSFINLTTLRSEDFIRNTAIGDFDGNGILDVVVATAENGRLNTFLGNNNLVVKSTIPSQNAGLISRSSDVAVTFSHDIKATGYDSDSGLVVIGSLSGFYDGSYSYNSGTKTLTFNPSENFKSGEVITVTAGHGIRKNTDNSALNLFTYSFVVESGLNIDFSSRVNYSTGQTPYSHTVGDVDNDGDIDVVTANYDGNSVSVLLNQNNGSLAAKVDYSAGSGTNSVSLSDLDRDGYLDIVTTNGSSDNISVLMNNGNATFASAVNYSTGNEPDYAAFGDLDGDGDQDVVISHYLNGTEDVVIMKNNGDGTLVKSSTLNLNLTGRYFVFLNDLDNDGDLDLIRSSQGNNKFEVWINLGDATFVWSTYSGYTASNLRSIGVADLDGDGYSDIIAPNYTAPNINVYKNNKSGYFGSPTGYTVGSGPYQIAVADLNADGDMDVLTPNYNGNNFSLLLNNGDGTFAAHKVFSTGANPDFITVADMNGDGFSDVIVSNHSDNTVSIFKGITYRPTISLISPAQNALEIAANSDIEITFGAPIDESTANATTIKVYGSLKGAYSSTFSYQSGSKKLTINPNENFAVGENITVILTTDIKNAGDLSLANSFTWSFRVKSQPAGSFSSKADYPVSGQPYFIESDDVDGDGDQDIITSNWISKEVSVLLNNGDGTLASATSFNIDGQPNNFISADLDGDGYIDFVSANTDSSSVDVLLSNGNGTLAEVVRYPIGNGLWTITSGDVDGDGDVDLITGNSNNYTLSILLNNGDGSFAEKINHSTTNNTTYISSGDVDGDGDIDLVTVNYYEENVTVFLNDGTGIFDAGTDYALGLQGGFITTADVDHDGDLDIITSSSTYISVLKNNGSGVFGSPDNNSAYNAWNVQPADIDGDGDLDLLSININDSKFSILSNNGNGTFAANIEYDAANSAAWINAVDLNGDGTLDIVIANDASNTISVFKGAVPSATDPTSGVVEKATFTSETTLTGNLSVTDTLTVGAQITTGSNTIDLGTTGKLSGETPSNYIVGKVQTTRTISSSQENIAGLGISIDPQSNNLGSTTIKRETGEAAGSGGIKQVWTISPTTQPSGPVTVTLTWPSTNDNEINLSDLVVYKSEDEGSTWNVLTATINKDSDPRTATFTISSFSMFTIGGPNAVLPVELASFTFAGNKLNWATATETNNSGWEIESRQLTSDNGQQKNADFRKIGFVAGKGTTTEKQNYSFSVSNLLSSVSKFEFRLKQIDTDGKFAYSNILSVELKPETYSLSQNYPNPFNPNTVINYQLPISGNVKLVVFDMLGRELLTLVNEEKLAGSYSVKFDGSKMTSGIYFYKISAGNYTETKKMMLVK